MNNTRRKAIQAVIESLQQIPASDIVTAFDEAKEAVECINSDEQDAFENMPEGLQYGDKGEAAQEAISNLEYAEGELEELSEFLEKLDQVISYLEDAAA